jgi:Tol biopolymer transport system component
VKVGVMMRIGGLIGGMVLLIMAVGGSVLRAEVSGAYWIAYYEMDNTNNVHLVIATADGEVLRRLPTLYSPLGPITFSVNQSIIWPEHRFIYRLYENRSVNQTILTRTDVFNSSERIVETVGLRNIREFDTDRFIVRDQDGLYQLNGKTGARRLIVESHGQSLGIGGLSPNGEWLVISYDNPDGTFTFHRIRLDGSGEALLPLEDFEPPIWSPDGSSVLYLSYRDRVPTVIRETNGVGSEILNGVDNIYRLYRWLPSDWILLDSIDVEQNQPHIFRMRPDGSDMASLLQQTYGDEWLVALSKDGQWVLISVETTEITELHRINLDTLESNLVYSTPFRLSVVWTTLTDDGAWVLFKLEADEINGLYRISPDGSDFAPLIEFDAVSPYQWWSGSVSPTSKWVYMPINRGGTSQLSDLVRINIESGKTQQLSNQVYSFEGYSPVFQAETPARLSPTIGIFLVLLSILPYQGLWRVIR